jgi:uncharacterized protein (DUF934 family)
MSSMKLIFNSDKSADALQIANDADPVALQADIAKAAVIDLHFPKFTDGRAYSQAALIRKRLGFKGELRATGDVLVDQLQLMQRTGFSTAVLRDGQSMAAAERMLALFSDFYQGDVRQALPAFAREVA